MYQLIEGSGDIRGRYADAETAWRKLREHVRKNPRDVGVVLLLVDDEHPLESRVLADARGGRPPTVNTSDHPASS